MRFSADFRPKFSKNFRGREIFARDHAEMRAARRRAASPRPAEVLKHCGKRRHDAEREISCDSQRISDRNFRKFFAAAKFSREITPKCVPPDDAQPRHDPQRPPSFVLRVGMMRHVRFCAILSEFPIEIFEKNSRPRHFRARSRRNTCRPTTRSLATTRRDPQALCQASARCGT